MQHIFKLFYAFGITAVTVEHKIFRCVRGLSDDSSYIRPLAASYYVREFVGRLQQGERDLDVRV